MLKLIEIYTVKTGPSHKKLRAKVKIKSTNKIVSVWCGKQIGEFSITEINRDENLVRAKNNDAVVQFGTYKL